MEPRKFINFLLVFIGYISTTKGNLNLYMNETEARRLLGIEGELFYVRDGQINTYALSFNVPIKPHIDRIYFNWQNVRTTPPTTMLYKLSVTTSNPQALYQPIASITQEGVVPTSLKVFSISLRCTGHITAEVSIKIQLNVTLHNASNITVINMNRRKMCSEECSVLERCAVNMDYHLADGALFHHLAPLQHGLSQHLTPPGPQIDHPQPTFKPEDKNKHSGNSSYVVLSDGQGSMNTNIFYIAVGSACGVILLVALFVAIYYVRSSKSGSHNERLSDTSSARTMTPHQKAMYQRAEMTTPNGFSRFPQFPELVSDYASEVGSARGMHQDKSAYMRAETPNNVMPVHAMPRGMSPVGYVEVTSESAHGILAEIQVDRSRVSLAEVLMEGTFGKLYHGILRGEDDKDLDGQQHVIVKTVTDAARPDQVEVMLREGCVLKGLLNPNIYPVIAACSHDDSMPPYLIYPHANETNLKKFLQRCKISDVHQPLNTQQIVFMAIQVIRGVQFLHRKRIVHRDLAARNCVVDNRLTVRVTDNALARDFFPNDYHCLGDNENRPVKWLSIEALIERKFSAASDVWAFGVVIWELLTLAQQPYADVDPFEMATYLREGFRIAQPMNCPDELFAVMACCWALNAEERPKFSQLQVCLQDFYAALGRFV